MVYPSEYCGAAGATRKRKLAILYWGGAAGSLINLIGLACGVRSRHPGPESLHEVAHNLQADFESLTADTTSRFGFDSVIAKILAKQRGDLRSYFLGPAERPWF